MDLSDGLTDWWELWVRWWRGELVSVEVLWGQRVFEWGRVGKMMQFAGALTIIVEIVGPERLDRLGLRLRRFRWSTVVGSNISEAMWPDNVGDPPRKPSSADILLGTLYKLACWCWVLFLPLAAYHLTGNIFVVVGVLMLLALLLVLSIKSTPGPPALVALPVIALTIAMAAIIGLLGFILDRGVVHPLAVALRAKNVVRVSQIVAVTLLVVGFQFDLLSA